MPHYRKKKSNPMATFVAFEWISIEEQAHPDEFCECLVCCLLDDDSGPMVFSLAWDPEMNNWVRDCPECDGGHVFDLNEHDLTPTHWVALDDIPPPYRAIAGLD